MGYQVYFIAMRTVEVAAAAAVAAGAAYFLYWQRQYGKEVGDGGSGGRSVQHDTAAETERQESKESTMPALGELCSSTVPITRPIATAYCNLHTESASASARERGGGRERSEQRIQKIL